MAKKKISGTQVVLFVIIGIFIVGLLGKGGLDFQSVFSYEDVDYHSDAFFVINSFDTEDNYVVDGVTATSDGDILSASFSGEGASMTLETDVNFSAYNNLLLRTRCFGSDSGYYKLQVTDFDGNSTATDLIYCEGGFSSIVLNPTTFTGIDLENVKEIKFTENDGDNSVVIELDSLILLNTDGPSCSDGILNGDELRADFGGDLCPELPENVLYHSKVPFDAFNNAGAFNSGLDGLYTEDIGEGVRFHWNALHNGYPYTLFNNGVGFNTVGYDEILMTLDIENVSSMSPTGILYHMRHNSQGYADYRINRDQLQTGFNTIIIDKSAPDAYSGSYRGDAGHWLYLYIYTNSLSSDNHSMDVRLFLIDSTAGTCNDGILNGDEEIIDKGGEICPSIIPEPVEETPDYLTREDLVEVLQGEYPLGILTSSSSRASTTPVVETQERNIEVTATPNIVGEPEPSYLDIIKDNQQLIIVGIIGLLVIFVSLRRKK